MKSYRIKFLIFAALNIVFVAAILFWLVPAAQNLQDTRANIARQENYNNIRIRHILEYEENWQDLAELTAARRFIETHEVLTVIENVRQVAIVNGFAIAGLTVSEHIVLSAGMGQIVVTSVNIGMTNEGCAQNFSDFLREVADITPAMVVQRFEFVWPEPAMARINIDLRIFST